MRTVLWTLLEALRCIGILMQPLTPQASIRMLDQLGIRPSPSGSHAGSAAAPVDDARSFAAVSPGHAVVAGTRLPAPAPVFPRIELEEAPPSAQPAAAPAVPTQPSAHAAADDQCLDAIDDVEGAVREQGERVRALKAAKADKAQIDSEVAKLLKLKGRLAAAPAN